MHFPMYSDNPTETTDTYLHSGGTSLTDTPDGVASLLSQNSMQYVFNGHAHIYERNAKQAGESFVSYVTGGGGATLEPVSGCHSFDAYAIGWSPTKLKGSKCGSATAPTSASGIPLPARDRQRHHGNRGADRRDGTDLRRPDHLVLARRA